MSGQESFNPVDYCFAWTADGWYSWDRPAAIKAAKQARTARVKELKARGITPRPFTLSSQLISRGGIGSGRPHVEFVTSVYYLNY